jgi:hypothetical protein
MSGKPFTTRIEAAVKELQDRYREQDFLKFKMNLGNEVKHQQKDNDEKATLDMQMIEKGYELKKCPRIKVSSNTQRYPEEKKELKKNFQMLADILKRKKKKQCQSKSQIKAIFMKIINLSVESHEVCLMNAVKGLKNV